ncbi:MAG: DUF4037 domain-containing protein, partial [Candidatus Latescibacterota bacterium]
MATPFSDRYPRAAFIQGLDLAEGFYHEVVRPMLGQRLPDLQYSAALIGGGSEVLGFDTEMSPDHDWGPRVMLFLQNDAFDARASQIRALAMRHLPLTYRDYPIRNYAPDIRDAGARHRLRPGDPGLEPRIEVYTLHGFLGKYMGLDLEQPMSPADWLTIPQHKLRSVVAGRVFHDGLGLQAVRDRFAWYPHGVWLYVLASCWARIGEDEVLTGRAGSVGDKLGSAVIAWRLVRDAMRLALLMERSYPPYAKWLGSAFAQLRCAATLLPLLERVGAAPGWQERDRALADVYRELVRMHNALGLTPPIPCEPRRFWERPFTIIGGGSIAEALRRGIRGPSVRAIADRWLIGSVDLVSDCHALDDDPALRPVLMALYQ